MKNIRLYSVMAVALLCGMSSCNEKWEIPNEEITEKGYGTLSTEDMVIDVTNAEKIVQSRAADIDLSDFIITVYDKATEEPVAKWKYSEMPGLPTFETGEYYLKVESTTLQKVAWDAPYFVGKSKDFTIVNKEVTKVGTIICKLQNLKVSVVFEDDLVNASAGDLKCVVYTKSDKEGDGLTFTPDEKRAGYFELAQGNVSMIAEFTGTVNGYSESIVETFPDVMVGEHHIITFKLRESDWNLGDPTGGMSLGSIQVDMSVENHNMTGNINAGDEGNITGNRPGQEDWGEEPTPPGPDDPTPGEEAATFVCPDGNLDLEGVNPVDVPTAIVVIQCKEGFKNLNVEIKSTNDAFLASAGELMPLNFDLANPGSAGEGLSSVGLPVGDDVRGKTEITFNITALVPLLASFPGDHTFMLEVVDVKGNKSSLVLRFKA